MTHREFRLPELLSVCQCLGVEIALPSEEERALDRAFMVIGLENDNVARTIASRCVLIKGIYAFYARGSTYEELHTMNKSAREKWAVHENSSFKFLVSAVGHTIPKERIRSTIESFSYMDYKGPINLKNPDATFCCWEEYWEYEETRRDRYDDDGQFRHVYFGRLLCEGASRPLIGKFDIKKRVFYGNTSMDPEMSLLMANQGMAAPGKMVYDPFAGTGSMLYKTAAHFGAYIFGSDMDGRQMRGKEREPGIRRAAAQYGLSSRFMDCATFDVTRNPWRCGGIFDAIITDPPYGVRAGAKRLGGKAGKKPIRETPVMLSDGELAHTKSTYIPPMRPYELSDLAQDLVYLALYLLKPGGRLVFFLPTVTDEYKDVDIPTCAGMSLVSNSLQDFGKWGRRLITMEKTTTEIMEAPRFDGSHRRVEDNPVPAHRDFREKYFSRFAPSSVTGSSAGIS